MAKFVLFICLALIAFVVAAPGVVRERRFYDGGYNHGGFGGYGGYGHGGQGGLGGQGFGGLIPHGSSQSFSKSSASSSSVSGGVGLG